MTIDLPPGTQTRLDVSVRHGIEDWPYGVLLAAPPHAPTADAFLAAADSGAMPLLMVHDAGTTWTNPITLAAVLACLKDAGIAALHFTSLHDAMQCRTAIEAALGR